MLKPRINRSYQWFIILVWGQQFTEEIYDFVNHLISSEARNKKDSKLTSFDLSIMKGGFMAILAVCP